MSGGVLEMAGFVLLTIRDPHDSALVVSRRVLDERTKTSLAVVQFFLGRHKFLCCPPTPSWTSAFRSSSDGLLAHVTQSTARSVMKISTIVELDEGSVQIIAGVLLFFFSSFLFLLN